MLRDLDFDHAEYEVPALPKVRILAGVALSLADRSTNCVRAFAPLVDADELTRSA